MVADASLPSPDRTLPRGAIALLQLLTAAAAAVALYWLSLRLFSGALAQADRYGDLPAAVTPLIETAVSGLVSLQLIALTALWLRDLGGAPVPRALPQFVRAVMGAWGWILAALVLSMVIFAVTVPFLSTRSFFMPDAASAWTLATAWHLVLAHDLLMLVMWLLFLPRALARLCGLPWRTLRARTLPRRLACLAILAIPAVADMAGQVLLADALLFLDPDQEPWRFLGLLYAQATGVTLLTALALLAIWRISRPGLHKTVAAA